MAGNADNLLLKVGDPGSATNLTAGYTAGNASITVASTANWTATGEGVIFAIDRAEVVNGIERQIAGTYNEFEGTVASATSITNVDWVRGAGDTDYDAGALTRVYIPVSAERENRIVDWGLVHADQDGTLKAGAVDVAGVLASDVVTTAKILDSNVTEAKLASGFHGTDGYIDATETWTYVSATTFKITGTDVSVKFPVGTRVRLTQTTAKYFYVTACTFSTDTTVTVTGGSDYTLANAAITSPMYSYLSSPQSFPQWFNYVPAWTNLTIGNATTTYRFNMYDKTIRLYFKVTLGTTSSISGLPNFTLPVTASSSMPTSGGSPLGTAWYEDAGVNNNAGIIDLNATTTARLLVFTADTTYGRFAGVSSTVPFTFGNTDIIAGNAVYEVA